MGLKRGRGTDLVPAHATFRKTIGAPSLVPPKFKRQLKTTQIVEDAEADYQFPAGLEGNEVLVDLKQDPRSTTTASLVTIEEELLTTSALRSYRRDKDALLETLDESLVNETDPPPTLNEFVTTAEQEALGDGRAIRRVGTVPVVFGNVVGETSIPSEVTPLEFRATLPTHVFANTSAGTADPLPDLQPGWFARREEQVDAFRFRQSTTARDLSLLPVTLIASRTTKDKQVEHVLRTLEDDTTVPAVPTALLDVKFNQLGDGTAIEEWDYVDTLFTEPSFTTEIQDPVPPKFRILFPTQRWAALSVGTAAPPTLLASELSHSAEQINVFVKRDTTTFRDAAELPVSLTDYKMTGKQQVATVVSTLATGLQSFVPTSKTTEANVENLGNNTSLKVVGLVPTLFTEPKYSAEIQDLTPPKFRALRATRRSSILSEATSITPPTLDDNELSHTVELVNAFVKRDDSVTRNPITLPVSLHEYKQTPEKQLETVISTLDDGLQTIIPGALIIESSVDNLGDGTSVKVQGTVPTLFTKQSYSAEIQDLTPLKFRALRATRRTSVLSIGTATPVTLDPNELSHISEQVDAFVKRDESVSRFEVVLPVSLIEYKMTPEQQVATVVSTLDDGIQTIDPYELTLEANVDNLGDGSSVKTEGTVEEVFPKDSYTKSILNLIPEKLRAAIKQTETTFDEPGEPSSDPTLLTGELSRTESRVTNFIRRIRVIKLGAVSVPVETTDYGTTEQFGGGTTTIVSTLHNHGAMVVDSGLRVIKSDLIDLGNGYDVKTTESVTTSAWPALRGQEYDQRLDVPIPFTQQTKDAGTGLGSVRTEIKPQDVWRQQNTSYDITDVAAVLDAYVLSYPTKVNVDMPDKLVSVTGIIESSLGEGASSEDGSFVFIGNYSVSLDLRASAQSSATLIPDIVPGIKQFWGNNIPCTQYHFFLPNPVTPAEVITRLTTLIGSPVLAWPKFNPEIVTMVATGEKASLQAVASSKGSSSVNDSSSSSTTGGGIGYSRERGLSLKTVRISPTIHDNIIVGGATTGSQDISATATAEATGLGPAETSDQTDNVAASISPSVIPATTGATDWPITGIYLYRLDAQPYRFGYVQFQAIIVDADDFPINP